MGINVETLNGLIRSFSSDRDDLDMIVKAIESFEDYHKAIYRQEITRRLFSCGAIEAAVYRTEMTERDRRRTLNHNAVLAQVKCLNRLAEEVVCRRSMTGSYRKSARTAERSRMPCSILSGIRSCSGCKICWGQADR